MSNKAIKHTAGATWEMLCERRRVVYRFMLWSIVYTLVHFMMAHTYYKMFRRILGQQQVEVEEDESPTSLKCLMSHLAPLFPIMVSSTGSRLQYSEDQIMHRPEAITLTW